jgi:hypothetical protein
VVVRQIKDAFAYSANAKILRKNLLSFCVATQAFGRRAIGVDERADDIRIEQPADHLNVSAIIRLTAEVESLDVKALHELDEGGFSLLGQQPFQFHGTNDDRGILAANGDALWPFALGPSNHLAEMCFGVLELPPRVTC